MWLEVEESPHGSWPVRGAELTRSQIERGADVIFQAAGATGLGVLQAAADAGKYGIGVDSNQNHLHPGHVLTSMVKRLDVAVQKAFQEAREGRFKPGTRVLGLEEEALDEEYDVDSDDWEDHVDDHLEPRG